MDGKGQAGYGWAEMMKMTPERIAEIRAAWLKGYNLAISLRAQGLGNQATSHAANEAWDTEHFYREGPFPGREPWCRGVDAGRDAYDHGKSYGQQWMGERYPDGEEEVVNDDYKLIDINFVTFTEQNIRDVAAHGPFPEQEVRAWMADASIKNDLIEQAFHWITGIYPVRLKTSKPVKVTVTA